MFVLTNANHFYDSRQRTCPVPGSGTFAALVEARRDRSALSKEVVQLRRQLDVQASQLRDIEVWVVVKPCRVVIVRR